MSTRLKLILLFVLVSAIATAQGWIEQLDVGNLNFQSNEISSTNTDGNVSIDPSGTGTIELEADTNVTGNLGVSGSVTFESLTVDDITLDGNTISTGDSTSLNFYSALGDYVFEKAGSTPTLKTTDNDHLSIDPSGSGNLYFQGTTALIDSSLNFSGLNSLSVAETLNFSEQSSTPSSPSVGTKKLYAKDDGKLYTLDSTGAEVEVGSGAGGGGGSEFNIVPNGGFEQVTGFEPDNWAVSGGTVVASTGNPMFGERSATWDSSDAAQTFCSDEVSAAGLGGNNGEAFIYSRGTASYTHKLQVRDGDDNVLAETDLLNPPTLDGFTTKKTSINFIFPNSSEDVKLCVLSVASNETNIALDGAYLGPATNIGTVAQARITGSAIQVGASGCVYTENTSSGLTDFVDLGNGSGCNAWSVKGNLASVGSNSHQMTHASMSVGSYEITITGMLFKGGTSGQCNFRLSDGTNTSNVVVTRTGGTNTSLSVPNLVFYMDYNDAATRTFKIQASDDHSDHCQLDNTSTGQTATWTFKYFPSYEQQVYTTDQSDYGPTPYTPTITGFGTPTGVSFWHQKIGSDMWIWGQFTSSSGDASPATITLPSGRTSASTINSKYVPSYYVIDANSGAHGGAMLIGPGETTVKMSANTVFSNSTSVSTDPANGNSIVFGSVTITIQPMKIPIQGWQTTNRAPQLVNSVINGSNGVTRIESASMTSGGVVTETSGSDWINGNASVAGSVFTYTINSGMWSSAPTCFVSVTNDMSGAAAVASIHTVTTSSFKVTTANPNVSATAYAHNVFCMGPK